MTRQELADLLGVDTLKDIARFAGVSPQAISQWRDPLSPALEDKVCTLLWRMKHPRAPERRRARSLRAA